MHHPVHTLYTYLYAKAAAVLHRGGFNDFDFTARLPLPEP